MRKNAAATRERLKQVLLSDKMSAPDGLVDVLKSDLIRVTDNYFQLYPSSFKVDINIIEGIYEVEISFKAMNVKNIKKI